MDRYRRVEKPREESPINENEIRITSRGRTRNYITYATSLLQEKGSDEIVLKAMGRAINKTVMISELIKRRILGLHQVTSTGSTDITDTWEPLEEGLLPLETMRHVSMITITLSRNELDTSFPGYQPPLPIDQVKLQVEFEEDAPPVKRGRGRGGRGPSRSRVMSNGGADYDDDGGWYGGRGYDGGRGRGRGRTRGFRGRDRRYSVEEMHDDYNEYDAGHAAPARARGRGRGGRSGGRSGNFVSDEQA